MMQTWNYCDKTQWPERGPWDHEPDKAQWTDEATGLACLMVRNHSNWCGYVAVTEGHSCFGKKWHEVDVDVHGGITFTGFCQEGDHEPKVCHIPEPGQPDRVWWLGFDCAHSGDKRPATDLRTYEIDRRYPMQVGYETYKDFNYVLRQVTQLAMQLSAIGGRFHDDRMRPLRQP